MFGRLMLVVMLVTVPEGMLTPAGSPALAQQIEPGDAVVTVADDVPVQVELDVLYVLGQDTELLAGEIQDEWVTVTVGKGDNQVEGWVDAEHLAVLKRKSEAGKDVRNALDSIRADQRYTAFSLKAAREKIEAMPSGQNFRALGSEVFHLGGITSIRGLVVDPTSSDAILVGQYMPGRARLTLDDLVVALRARFVHGEWPVISIDPPVDSQGYYTVRYEGGVRNTRFGQDLFDADYLLKEVGLGYVPAGVPGVRSDWELWLEESQRRYRNRDIEISARAWFFPIIAATPRFSSRCSNRRRATPPRSSHTGSTGVFRSHDPRLPEHLRDVLVRRSSPDNGRQLHQAVPRAQQLWQKGTSLGREASDARIRSLVQIGHKNRRAI